MEQSEFCKWINEYHERFGESFPVMVFYGRDEIVIDKIKKCLSNDENLTLKQREWLLILLKMELLFE